MNKIKPIKDMTYVEFMAFLSETNRPAGGKVALKEMLDYCNIKSTDKILDIGCNTGFCSFESARIIGCEVVGIDLSEEMISVAKKKLEDDFEVKDKIKFIVGDAKNMPFKDNEFDFVFSGGSTAFLSDISSTLEEYKRVVKPWGFIGDINFYYEAKPRQGLIEELNKLMGTNIEEWDKNRWIDLYEAAGLEVFDVIEKSIESVNEDRINKYVEELLSDKPEDLRKEAKDKLKRIMALFNENHKYLGFGIFILRKRMVKEEPFLFYP